MFVNVLITGEKLVASMDSLQNVYPNHVDSVHMFCQK